MRPLRIPLRQMLLILFLLWIAALLQGRFAHTVSIRGAEPDLPLVMLSLCALLVGGVRGGLFGFWTGLLAAVALPTFYGSVFTGRLAAGIFAGSLGGSLSRANLLVPPLVTLAATLLSEIVGTLIAPGPALHHHRLWLVQTCTELLYNTALALPVSLLLRVCRVGQEEQDTFGMRR